MSSDVNMDTFGKRLSFSLGPFRQSRRWPSLVTPILSLPYLHLSLVSWMRTQLRLRKLKRRWI
jgi:hypothetical protein